MCCKKQDWQVNCQSSYPNYIQFSCLLALTKQFCFLFTHKRTSGSSVVDFWAACLQVVCGLRINFCPDTRSSMKDECLRKAYKKTRFICFRKHNLIIFYNFCHNEHLTAMQFICYTQAIVGSQRMIGVEKPTLSIHLHINRWILLQCTKSRTLRISGRCSTSMACSACATNAHAPTYKQHRHQCNCKPTCAGTQPLPHTRTL